MKKLLALIILSLCVQTFAAPLAAKTTDKETLLKCVNDKCSHSNMASFIIAKIDKKEGMDTYKGLKDTYVKINGSIDYKFYSVLIMNPLFKDFRIDSWNEVKIKDEEQFAGLKMMLLRSPKGYGLDISKDESWKEIYKIVVNNNINNGKQFLRSVEFLIKNDVKVLKDEKIKAYTEIYEKYLPVIIDEQNLKQNEKYFTLALSKISLKLKALGVTVK